ncbi:MAG: hypothetical protein AAF394_03545 [Planctomycetota bacterium]
MGADRRFRTARIWSNDELRKMGHLFHGDVVNVSAGENVDKEGSTYDAYFPNADEFFLTNYSPGAFRGYEGRENEFLVDLEGDLPEELHERFDVVFNHTTLEHVFHVHKAFANLADMSRDLVIIVVPFAQIEHYNDGYKDYFRHTPQGMRRFYAEHGMEVIYESESPHENAAVYLYFVGSKKPEQWKGKMPSFEPIGHAGEWIGRPSKNPLARLAQKLGK